MFVPEFFYGSKYSDVRKKLSGRRNKTLKTVQNMYDKINQNITDEIYHDVFVINLSDTYLSCKLTNAYHPFIFSNYIMKDSDNSDIIRWFKEKSIENRWCQLSALAQNSVVAFLYKDKDYAKRLGDSVCLNWDFYLSFGERFCFMPIFQKKDNMYFFWENNLALAQLLFSVTGRTDLITLDEEFEAFPTIWKKYT